MVLEASVAMLMVRTNNGPREITCEWTEVKSIYICTEMCQIMKYTMLVQETLENLQDKICAQKCAT